MTPRKASVLILFLWPVLLCPLVARASGAGERHPVLDLIASRTLAHMEQRGGLFIPAGTPGFAKYNHFGRPTALWRLLSTEDGRRVALAQASARLDVPLGREQAAAQVVFLALKAPARSSVKVSANGKASASVALSPGWQTAEVKLPAGALREGENQLLLTFAQSGRFGTPQVKAAAAVEWIQVGGSAPAAGQVTTRLSEGERLLVPGGGALYYYVQVPEGGALSMKGGAHGCTLSVSVDDGGAQPAKLDGSLFELAGHAGSVRRLGLHALGSCEALALDRAELHTAGPPPRVSRAERPKNIVFWLSDDTRADRLRMWNPRSRVETPVLSEFDRRSTRFQVAYVQGNESRVSHASLFTGTYPSVHKFVRDKAVLSESLDILPEVMKKGGLYTIGHIANGYISKRWGFGDGWDFMKNHIHEGGGLKAKDLVAAAAAFLEKGAGRSKPFFLYLGTIDAHVSWRAYEPWIGKYDPRPYSGPFVKGCMDPQLDKIVAGTLQVTERDKERIRALYDCDISYNDMHFGALIDLLRKTGHERDTLIVYTSDHGEEFWEHGRIGHGHSLRQELIHVPLWIHFPPLFPPGKVVEEGVEVADLLPTLADAIEAKVPEGVQGESLLPLAQGVGAGYPRPAVSSQYELAHTMRLGRWKLWVGGSGQVRFFDAHSDPGEETDLVEQRPRELRFVSDAMGLWMAYQERWKKSRWGVASNHLPGLPRDLER